MSSLDDAIAAAIARQKEAKADSDSHVILSEAHSAESKGLPAAQKDSAPVDPWSPEAILRAANEDDDLYDPYSDYMDALARSSYEEPEADPWR